MKYIYRPIKPADAILCQPTHLYIKVVTNSLDIIYRLVVAKERDKLLECADMIFYVKEELKPFKAHVTSIFNPKTDSQSHIYLKINCTKVEILLK